MQLWLTSWNRAELKFRETESLPYGYMKVMEGATVLSQLRFSCPSLNYKVQHLAYGKLLSIKLGRGHGEMTQCLWYQPEDLSQESQNSSKTQASTGVSETGGSLALAAQPV